jgi:hypothetical protein
MEMQLQQRAFRFRLGKAFEDGHTVFPLSSGISEMERHLEAVGKVVEPKVLQYLADLHTFGPQIPGKMAA